MKTKVGLFGIFFFLITLFKGFGAESNSNWYFFAFVLGCIAVGTKVRQDKFTVGEIRALSILVVVGLLDFVIGRSTTILFTAIAFCGLKKCDTNHLIKIAFWTRLVTFITLVFVSVTGIIKNNILLFWRNGAIINRYSFGYSHPNMAQASLTIIIILCLYLYGEKFHMRHYVFIIAIDYAFYRFTYSRTGFLIGIVCIFFDFAIKNGKIRKFLMQIFKNCYWLFFVISILGGLLYGKISLLSKLDAILTGRIQYISILLKTTIPPLIGSNKYNVLVNIDNGYIALLYEGGLIAFIWFSYYITRTIKKAYRDENYKKFFLILDFMLYAMTESFFPSIAVNVSLLFVGDILFNKKQVLHNE